MCIRDRRGYRRLSDAKRVVLLDADGGEVEAGGRLVERAQPVVTQHQVHDLSLIHI